MLRIPLINEALASLPVVAGDRGIVPVQCDALEHVVLCLPDRSDWAVEVLRVGVKSDD